MKKILFTAIGIMALILVRTSVCLADSEIYCSPGVSENLSVLCQYTQDTLEIKYDDETGKNAYFIPNSSTSDSEYYTKYARTLNFYIDDNVFFGNTDFEKTELEIEYKDVGLDYFYVTYDSYDGKKICNDYVELYNTNQIKKAIIELDDARFSNNCSIITDSLKEITENADFSVTVPRRKDGTGIYIYGITVKRTGIYGGVKISSAGSLPGNIFFDSVNKELRISFKNNRSDNINMNVTYSVSDSGKLCMQKNKNIFADGGAEVFDTVNLSDISRYGTYTLRVEAQQEGLYATKDIPFSVCVDASEGGENIPMGIGTHFSWGRDSRAGLSIIKKAGISSIRDGYNWFAFETVKGVYNEPVAYTEYLANAHKNGFDVLTAAAYGNTLYGMSSQQNMPETDEQRQAYVNYILEMLRLNYGKIDVIEVWNEPDSSIYNPNAYDNPEVYIRLLQAVSEALRSEYPDVKIAGPALSSATLQSKAQWLEELLSSSITDADGSSHFASEYFDIVTIHHYALNYDRSIKGTMEALEEIKNIFAKYGCENKKIYHTEFGTSDLERNGTDLIKSNSTVQAEKLSRYYLGLRGSNAGDKFYIYDFSDDDFAENIIGYNLGITGPHTADVPYYAKPALLAAANINKLIGAMEATEYRTFETGSCAHTGQNRHYGYEIRFKGASDDSIVAALFTDSEDMIYTFCSDGRLTEFFDLFGNRIYGVEEINGEYLINIGKSPIFARMLKSNAVVYAFNGNGCVVLNGNLGDAEQSVTVKILNENDKIIFLGETKTDTDGYFEFNFEIADKKGIYIALVGSPATGGVYGFSFDASALDGGLISVYSGTKRIVSASEFCSGEPLDISAEFFNGNEKPPVMIIAYYQGNSLINAKIIRSSEMTEKNNCFTAHIEEAPCPNAEKVSVFVFDSTDNLCPLIKNLTLN